MEAVAAAIAVVEKNLRLPIPENTPTPLKLLMLDCWRTQPSERPDMEVLEFY
jgi:hypothetical protein